MLPPPALSFTIPSIHDDLELQCRVYHPPCLAPASGDPGNKKQWRKRAAIVAHPYAPLGGSFDDPVVGLVASTALKRGWVVGMFNFRGAGTSKGRTSWQGKAEQKDYISFVGFMVYYLHHLNPPQELSEPPKPSFTSSDPGLHNLSPIPSQAIPPSPHSDDKNKLSRLLLAGYSYGALITCCLPPMISSVIEPFQTPAPGSPHAEIRLRAEFLASQQNHSMEARKQSSLRTHRRGRSLQIDDQILTSSKVRNTGIRAGGEETPRRASHESFRSRSSLSMEAPERVRRSMEKIRSIGKTEKGSLKSQASRESVSSHDAKRSESDSPAEVLDKSSDFKTPKAIPGITHEFSVAYLLVSPLQGFINALATMWSNTSLRDRHSISENEMKFTVDPTLAIFGDDDVFVSVKRLRNWVERIEGATRQGEKGLFRYREVQAAGHFWHDREAWRTLEGEVEAFVGGL